MNILHINAGNETGGGMYHILNLLQEFNREEFSLGVFEKAELYKRAREAGINTVYFSSKTKLSIPLIKKMANYIKYKKITYIHTHGPRANVYANILKRIAQFNWVVTVHSDPSHDFMGKGIYGNFLSKLNIRAIKNADRIVAISEQFKDQLVSYGVNNKKIISILNGIDFDKHINKSYQKKDFGLSEEDFLILMVARLEPIKAHNNAFQALKKLMNTNKKCHLMLLGDGSLMRELKQMSYDLNIHKNVHFLGYRDDVDYFYQMADITLLTSLSESFPLVLLESARAKTPVISTNVGCVNKLLPNKSVGWVVPPGDINQLTESLAEAAKLHKTGTLNSVGYRLYDYASTQFSLSTFADNIYNVYLSLEDAN